MLHNIRGKKMCTMQDYLEFLYSLESAIGDEDAATYNQVKIITLTNRSTKIWTEIKHLNHKQTFPSSEKDAVSKSKNKRIFLDEQFVKSK